MAQEVKFTPFGIPYVVEFDSVSVVGSTTSRKSRSTTASSKPAAPGQKHHPRPSLRTFPSSSSVLSTHSQNPKLFPVALDQGPPASPLSPTLKRASRVFFGTPSDFDAPASGGLYVHQGDVPAQGSRALRHLRQKIAEAVRAAGMDSPPSPVVTAAPPPSSTAMRASRADVLARVGSSARKAVPSLRIDVGRKGVQHLAKEVAAKAQKRAGAAPVLSGLAAMNGVGGMTKADKRGSLYRGTYGQVCAALMAAGLEITPCPESGVNHATRLGAIFVASQGHGGVQLRKLTLWG